MSMNYSIEIIEGITVARFSKSPKMSDWRNAFEDVAKIDKHGLRLWDLSCGLKDLTNNEIQELAELGKKIFSTPGKVALIAPQDITFGLARMHNVYREQEDIETEVFRTEQEALAWLKKNPE